jgi:hypothetical protein
MTMTTFVLGTILAYGVLWASPISAGGRRAWRNPPRLAQVAFRRGAGDLDVVQVAGQSWLALCCVAAVIGLLAPAAGVGLLLPLVGLGGAIAVVGTALATR